MVFFGLDTFQQSELLTCLRKLKLYINVNRIRHSSHVCRFFYADQAEKIFFTNMCTKAEVCNITN